MPIRVRYDNQSGKDTFSLAGKATWISSRRAGADAKRSAHVSAEGWGRRQDFGVLSCDRQPDTTIAVLMPGAKGAFSALDRPYPAFPLRLRFAPRFAQSSLHPALSTHALRSKCLLHRDDVMRRFAELRDLSLCGKVTVIYAFGVQLDCNRLGVHLSADPRPMLKAQQAITFTCRIKHETKLNGPLALK